MIKKYLKIAVVLLLLPALVHANEHKGEARPLALLVYKTPVYGGGKKWLTHIEDEGIIAHSEYYRNISHTKAKYGIKSNYRFCHTGVTRSGFAFEGHMLAMPVGSPGMEVKDRFMPYKVFALYKDATSKVYAEVKTYEEQF